MTQTPVVGASLERIGEYLVCLGYEVEKLAAAALVRVGPAGCTTVGRLDLLARRGRRESQNLIQRLVWGSHCWSSR